MEFNTTFVKSLICEIEQLKKMANTDIKGVIAEKDSYIDEVAKQNADLMKQNSILAQENVDKDKEIAELKRQLENSEEQKLRKELRDVKEHMRKPVTFGDNSFQIIKEIKEGNGCIQPLLSTKQGWKTLKTHPFTFEMGNKGCVFEEVQLKGCFERNGNNRKYFYNEAATENCHREIISQILGLNEGEAWEAKVVTKTTSKRGRKLRANTTKEILRRNPIFNVRLQRFVSDDTTKYVYTKNDGSKYIILENGEEEVV